jgi:hypothetical protein
MFRDFVFNSSFLTAYDIPVDVVEKIKNDEIELLKFSLRWLRFAMFGEGDFTVHDEAKKRARERQKAAAMEKAKLREEHAKKKLSKTPEEIMKEADRGE